MGHVHVLNERIAGVIITDMEYPTRVAFSIIGKILDEFLTKFPKNRWPSLNAASTPTFFPELRTHLERFQDPHSADPFMKVQRELDETKIILVSYDLMAFFFTLCYTFFPS